MQQAGSAVCRTETRLRLRLDQGSPESAAGDEVFGNRAVALVTRKGWPRAGWGLGEAAWC